MKKISRILFLLVLSIGFLLGSQAFASNFGVMQVTVNVGDSSELLVGGQTGANKGPEVGFSGVGGATTQSVADYFTTIEYKTNLASWKIEVTNVSTDNAVTMVDGLILGSDLTKQVSLWIMARVYDGVKNNPAINDAGWQQLFDSQRAAVLKTLFTGSAPVLNAIQQEVYYKGDFGGAIAGGYFAIIQYQLSTQ